MKKQFLRLLFICFAAFSCNENGSKNKIQEDYKTGEINICIDESYQPVFEEILKVYRSSFPNVIIHEFYKPENLCVKNLTNDSFRVVVLARNINVNEDEVMQQKLGYKARYGTVAYDAIALIGNKKNKDTLLSIKDVQDILSGSNKKYTPIVDGLSQSSVLRYLSEKILKNQIYSKALRGSKNSKELVENVAQKENLIGFIGVSWVGNHEDSLQLSFSHKIKIMSLPCANCEDKNIFVKPYQANLALNRYPFLREMTYVLKENYEGPGRGFVNFISNERGQLIFKRAYLVPAKMNFNVRNIKLSS